MISSKYLDLKPIQATFTLEYNENDKDNKTYILLEGHVKRGLSMAGNKFSLKCIEVGEEYEPDIIHIPNLLDKSKREEKLWCGTAILVEPDNDLIKEEFIEITLILKTKAFERLKYFVDQSFFSSNAAMSIGLSVVGTEPDYELISDKFPSGKHLPLIGYWFSIKSANKNTV